MASSTMSNLMGPAKTVTPEESAALKQKAREIYNRDRTEKQERERERREKEDAAKRARAEAADRGRQASREWAERQRKKLEAKKEPHGNREQEAALALIVVAGVFFME